MRIAWGPPAFEQAVADYVIQQFPALARFGRLRPYRAVGFVDHEGALRGGLVMTNYGYFDAELSIYIEKTKGLGGALGAEGFSDLFRWAFDDENLARLTARIGASNRRSQKFVERLGFRHEGTMRHGLDGVEDAKIYGMIRQDCRWLSGAPAENRPA